MSSKIVGWLVGAGDGKNLGFKKKSGILKKIPEKIWKWWILNFCLKRQSINSPETVQRQPRDNQETIQRQSRDFFKKTAYGRHRTVVWVSNKSKRRTKLDLMAEMLNFSIMTSCRLMTISLWRTLCGAWWVLGYILVIKGETERNYKLSLCEDQWSFWKLRTSPATPGLLITFSLSFSFGTT